MKPRTLYDKIWERHAIVACSGEEWLLAIDLHLLTEVTSPQAFAGLGAAGRQVAHPERTLAVADHNVPTSSRDLAIADPESRLQVETLAKNCADFSVPYIPLHSRNQGIVHVIGPELGLTLPGTTIICGDSHSSTHGAFGALAFGIGTSEVEHVLATQSLIQLRARSLLIRVEGALGLGVTAKDLALAIIGVIGAGGAAGHIIEYAGDAVRALDMAGRMTLANMSIEAGARAGLIAPDATTFAYLAGRPLAPKGGFAGDTIEDWRGLASDPGAVYDREVVIDADAVAPTVTWGTSPDMSIAIDGMVPDPALEPDPARAGRMRRSLDYMGLSSGQRLAGLAVDTVFVGSCTNGRIEDLRAAAEIADGRQVAPGVRALVVPGSGMVKAQGEAEGLDQIFKRAGFEWREPGCSMCVGMNPDRLNPGNRCASTSNRNFAGRQGTGGRTHLVSPAMAAAAAITGAFTDVRLLAPAQP